MYNKIAGWKQKPAGKIRIKPLSEILFTDEFK